MNEDRVWSYAKGGATVGPHTEAEIRTMIQQGSITAKDVLFKTGWTEWKSAKDSMPDAFAMSAPPPPPAPGAHAPSGHAAADKLQQLSDMKAPHIPAGASNAAESLIGSLPGGTESLVTRRIVGYLVDVAIVFVCSCVVGFAFGLVAGILGRAGGIIGLAGNCVLTLIILGYFLIRDGMFGGRSLGKLTVGLRVVDEATGAPATMVQSIKRNLVLLIPLVPIICAFQLPTGYRWGDKWAGVIVKRV